MIQYIKDILIIVFNPSFWIMNSRYSKKWDSELKNLMKKHDFIRVDTYDRDRKRPHYIDIGGVTLWVENHPYASFVPSGRESIGISGYRASRMTIIKANRKMLRDIAPVDVKRNFKLKELGI